VNAVDPLRNRWLAVAALVLSVSIVAVGAQQLARRVVDVEAAVLAPVALAAGLCVLVLAGGARRSESRRTPYW